MTKPGWSQTKKQSYIENFIKHAQLKSPKIKCYVCFVKTGEVFTRGREE